jgi:hypothetical protein
VPPSIFRIIIAHSPFSHDDVCPVVPVSVSAASAATTVAVVAAGFFRLPYRRTRGLARLSSS